MEETTLGLYSQMEEAVLKGPSIAKVRGREHRERVYLVRLHPECPVFMLLAGSR